MSSRKQPGLIKYVLEIIIIFYKVLEGKDCALFKHVSPGPTTVS